MLIHPDHERLGLDFLFCNRFQSRTERVRVPALAQRLGPIRGKKQRRELCLNVTERERGYSSVLLTVWFR